MLGLLVFAKSSTGTFPIPALQHQTRALNAKAARLRQYLSVVLSEEPEIFLWEHREFARSDCVVLAKDGIHCNTKGQYCLYRSYRGAILRALGML